MTRRRQATPADPIRRELDTARGRQSYWDFGGPKAGPLLHMAHANGFNGLTYRHVLAPLTDAFRVIAWDARGHGFSPLAADPRRLRAWGTYREDLVALIDALDEDLVLAGHSLGGATSVLAAGERPARVRGLILAEPVVPPSAFAVGLGIVRALGLGGDLNPMAKAALRRRRRFDDAEAMVDAYVGRGAFKTWPQAMIADYVAGGTRPSAEGQGIELACAPEWEAATFNSLPGGMTLALRRFRGPVILLAGEHHSTCPAPMAMQIQLVRPATIIDRVPGASHFLPMERPDLIQRAARALLTAEPIDPRAWR